MSVIISTLQFPDVPLTIGFAIGGFLVGFIIEKLVMSEIRARAIEKNNEPLQIALKSSNWIITLWLGLLGLFLASKTMLASAVIQNAIEKTIIVLGIISLTWFLLKISVDFIRYLTKAASKEELSSSIFVNITRLIILAIGGLLILHTFDISIMPLLTALGVAGFAVALALQDTLANLFAGLQILLSRQISIDDYVKLSSGEEGKVLDINWRNTTIAALSNNLIVIPNSKLASSIVTIYNLPDDEVSVSFALGIDYKSELDKVEKIAIETAEQLIAEDDSAVKNAKPFVRFQEFADSSINFKIFVRAKDYVSQFKLKHELLKRLHKKFDEEGIVIPYPIQTVRLEKEN